MDGVYRWVAFLPSRQDSRVPVPNRYWRFPGWLIKGAGYRSAPAGYTTVGGGTAKSHAGMSFEGVHLWAASGYIRRAFVIFTGALADLRANRVRWRVWW